MYNEIQINQYNGAVKPELLTKALKAFEEYKGQKQIIEQRVTENNKWYKSQYWNIIDKNSETQPATAFIFNAIENKYAEALDNFPQPSITERMQEDEEVASILTKIIPIQMDISGYKACYKENWRRKLKHGTAVYGVFYNEDKEDIDIKVIDILNIYCDVHIKDVQESPFLFITSVCDNDQLKIDYPKFASIFEGDATIKTYNGSYTVSDKTEIVDCYYKKYTKNGTQLHMMKLAEGRIIDASEDRSDIKNGLYSHGLYPVVFDVLYPEEDSPFGFGVIDVIKNPQIYIDKLDGAISKNAIIAGKIRYMIKDNGGINEKEVLDYSNDIIHVAGSVDDSNIRQLQAKALDDFVINHRQNKILELKEVIGNRDFQQGSTYGGVTAASAITRLQQAGEKISRSIIDDSYDAYKKIVLMVIELIREFYTNKRIYRITDELGKPEYKAFSGDMINNKTEYDRLGFDISQGVKPAEFDVSVIPKRENPLTKEVNNQTILSLWQSGLFKAENIAFAKIIIGAMQFDGKEKLLGQLEEQIQQMNNIMPVSQTIQ